jgi:formamidopyrimidine-DNA glycosylase
LTFDGGGVLYYRDIRKFGEMFVLPTEGVEGALRVGVEPLEPEFTPEVLQGACRSSSKIKSLLLNQTRIAGIGNIYADEALFRAGIRPTRRAASLRRDEIRSLHRAIRAVLRAGIRHRGSSIANYRDASGEPGRFVALHRVYQRDGEPCLACGTPIRRIVLGQRGTHFCPTCQR